jgi:hypothetical protein
MDSIGWDPALPSLAGEVFTGPFHDIDHVRSPNRVDPAYPSPFDECANAEDGHRAVQTLNGLVSNAVSSHFAAAIPAVTSN